MQATFSVLDENVTFLLKVFKSALLKVFTFLIQVSANFTLWFDVWFLLKTGQVLLMPLILFSVLVVCLLLIFKHFAEPRGCWCATLDMAVYFSPERWTTRTFPRWQVSMKTMQCWFQMAGSRPDTFSSYAEREDVKMRMQCCKRQKLNQLKNCNF